MFSTDPTDGNRLFFSTISISSNFGGVFHRALSNRVPMEKVIAFRGVVCFDRKRKCFIVMEVSVLFDQFRLALSKDILVKKTCD